MCATKIDARYQTPQWLYRMRKEVVRLHEQGVGVMAIVNMTGLSYPTVRYAINEFEFDGVQGLRPKPRGRKAGEGRKLTAEQENAICRTIRDKRPAQLGMDDPRWNRTAVKQLIACKFGRKLSLRTVGTYMKRWGITRKRTVKTVRSI
jgi:transposase